MPNRVDGGGRVLAFVLVRGFISWVPHPQPRNQPIPNPMNTYIVLINFTQQGLQNVHESRTAPVDSGPPQKKSE